MRTWSKLLGLTGALLLAAPTLLSCSGDESSSPVATGGCGGTGLGGSGGTATGGSGAVGVDCSQIPIGPFEAKPTPQFSFVDGEDIAFDGLGHIAGQRDSQIVLYTADGTEEVLAEVPGPGFSAASLYAISTTRAVYQIDVGVPGAPHPTPG